MSMDKLQIVKTVLQNVIDSIDNGNSNATEEECDEILDMINHTTNVQNKLSKYQACKYLGVSRATFDN